MSSCVVCFNDVCTCGIKWKEFDISKVTERDYLVEEINKLRELIDKMADMSEIGRYK